MPTKMGASEECSMTRPCGCGLAVGGPSDCSGSDDAADGAPHSDTGSLTPADTRAPVRRQLRPAGRGWQLRDTRKFVIYYQPKVEPRRRRRGRGRGAAALVPSRSRPGAAGRVHPAGRGDRPDRADRRLGAAHRLRPGPPLAAAWATAASSSRSTSRRGSSRTRTWSPRSPPRSRNPACRPACSSSS